MCEIEKMWIATCSQLANINKPAREKEEDDDFLKIKSEISLHNYLHNGVEREIRKRSDDDYTSVVYLL